MTETLKGILAEHTFFKGLEERYLDLLVGCASNVRVDVGEFFFRQGEEANHFYLLRHGLVSVEMFSTGRGPITVQTLGEGDVLGWSWLIPPYRWMFDARATQLTRAIALDGKCLRDKFDKDHDLGYELLNRFVPVIEQRLNAARLQLLNVYEVSA
jgi:CRP/FNR family transcriptional regulator, cyclic AMP receptor protein